MPNKIGVRANEILHFLEKEKHKNEPQKKFDALPKASAQISLFDIRPKDERSAGKCS